MWVMGGPMDVWDVEDCPWLVPEKRAIRRWVRELQRPVPRTVPGAPAAGRRTRRHLRPPAPARDRRAGRGPHVGGPCRPRSSIRWATASTPCSGTRCRWHNRPTTPWCSQAPRSAGCRPCESAPEHGRLQYHVEVEGRTPCATGGAHRRLPRSPGVPPSAPGSLDALAADADRANDQLRRRRRAALPQLHDRRIRLAAGCRVVGTICVSPDAWGTRPRHDGAGLISAMERNVIETRRRRSIFWPSHMSDLRLAMPWRQAERASPYMRTRTARFQSHDMVLARRGTAEVHVDRRSHAHGCDDGAEAVSVDVGSDSLPAQVLVDDRLLEGPQGVEQALGVVGGDLANPVSQLCEPLGERPDPCCLVELAVGVVVLVPEVQHTPREVCEPLGNRRSARAARPPPVP